MLYTTELREPTKLSYSALLSFILIQIIVFDTLLSFWGDRDL